MTGVGIGSSFGNSGMRAVNEVEVDVLPFDTISFRGKKPLFKKYPFRNCCAALACTDVRACLTDANVRFIKVGCDRVEP